MRLRADTGDFIRVFESNIPKKHTLQAAYEETERTHQQLTGYRKYHDYQSFAVVKCRKRRKT